MQISKYVLFLALAFPFAAHSGPTERRDLMLTVGDSISAGFLAASTALNAKQEDTPVIPEEVIPVFIGRDYDGHAIPNWKLWFAQFLNRNDHSWSSGDQLHSHYLKLKEILATTEPEVTLDVKNYARAGALSHDLKDEGDSIQRLLDSGKYQNIRYITLLIGVNDACADWIPDGIPDEEFSANIKNFFARIAKFKQSKPIRVLISSLPNVPNVGQKSIQNFMLNNDKSCAQQILLEDHYCNKLVYWKTPAEYQAKVALIERKNIAIQRLIPQMKKAFPNLEFAYSNRLFNLPIEIVNQAKDCFHPNTKGHELLSNQLWKDQPWW